MKLSYVYIILFFTTSGVVAMEKNIPSLPTEIKTEEIVRQIINSSRSRDEALTNISNYATVDTTLFRYIKNNKIELSKLLDQKFGLSFATLATGDYNNPVIKRETLAILQNEYQKIGKKLGVKLMLDGLVDMINGKTNTRSFYELNNILVGLKDFFENLFNTKDYAFIAVIIGAIKNLNAYFNFNTSSNKTEYLALVNSYISQFKNNKPINPSEKQILNLLISTGIQIFGKNFLLENHRTAVFTGSINDYAKKINNKTVLELIESYHK